MNKNNLVKIILILLFFFLLVGAGSYFYNDYAKVKLELNLLKTNPEKLTQEQEKALLDKVAKHVLLPGGERPSIATIVSLDQLKGQPFFANAKIGDKLLVFMKARKAFLYNPSEDKIIEVGPLVITSPEPTEKPQSKSVTPAVTAKPSPTIMAPTHTPTPTLAPEISDTPTPTLP